MESISRLADLEQARRRHRFLLVYFSGDNCGVCTALKPKILGVVARQPAVYAVQVNAHHAPEAAAQLSVFTIPAVLLFIEGREVIREARYLSVSELEDRIARYVDLAES